MSHDPEAWDKAAYLAKQRIAAVQSLQEELNRITQEAAAEKELERLTQLADEQQKEDLRNTKPVLIGLGGKLGSGKDAFADILVAQHGFTKLGMSDVLADALFALNPWITMDREMAKELFGAGVVSIRYQSVIAQLGYVEAKKIPEVRRLLQVLGTEVGREMISPTIWTDGARRRIQALRDAGHPVVITGLRFPNEIAMVEEEGGITAYVYRRAAEEAAQQSTAASAHASEGAVEEQFGVTLPNNGTLEDLETNAELYLESLKMVRQFKTTV